jgi:hypothetical protein
MTVGPSSCRLNVDKLVFAIRAEEDDSVKVVPPTHIRAQSLAVLDS